MGKPAWVNLLGTAVRVSVVCVYCTDVKTAAKAKRKLKQLRAAKPQHSVEDILSKVQHCSSLACKPHLSQREEGSSHTTADELSLSYQLDNKMLISTKHVT